MLRSSDGALTSPAAVCLSRDRYDYNCISAVRFEAPLPSMCGAHAPDWNKGSRVKRWAQWPDTATVARTCALSALTTPNV